MSESTKAVFLSYAREDTDAARRIAEALRGFGVEVWFDQAELRGGEAWDAKIKKQIRECALFVPLVSAQTQERTEGYFRREWLLAVERTRDMAANRAFVVPVVIDDTSEAEASVPDEFMRYQWTRLANAEPTPEFVAQVKRLLEAPKKPALKPDLPRPPTLPPEFKQAARARAEAAAVAAKARPIVPGWMWAVLAVVLVAVGLGVMMLRKPEPVAPPVPVAAARPVAPAAPAVGDKSIAVLPFTNMSEDKESGFFADGVHEDILTNLALVRELRVVSRTSVMPYRTTTKSMRQIAQELGVTYILEGSVRRAGNKVRVTGQLIHAATDEHVWAQAYDRDLTDIFAIQAELSQQIAAALKAALSPEEKILIARRPTENSLAYDFYLKGRASRNNSPTSSAPALREAEELFKSAVQQDPNFAAAWGELATVHALNAFWGIDGSPARLAAAEAAIAQAVRLAPEAPDVIRQIGTYAYYAHRDYARATEQYEKLARLQPNDPTVFSSLSLILRRQGRWTESLNYIHRAQELDPANVSYVRNSQASYQYGRHWGEFLASQQRLVAMLPGKLHEQFALAAAEYSATGSLKAADDLLARLPPVQRDSPTAIFFRRYWAITRGDYAEFKRLDQLQPAFEEEEWPALTAVTAATVYLAHGDPAAARARLATPMVELQLRVEREPSSPIAGAFLGMAEALLGHPEEAVRLVRKSMELLPESRDALDGPTYRYTLAWVYAVSGDKDRAIAELDRVLHEPSAFSVADIRANPGFEKLHGDPRFEALVNDPKNNAPLF